MYILSLHRFDDVYVYYVLLTGDCPRCNKTSTLDGEDRSGGRRGEYCHRLCLTSHILVGKGYVGCALLSIHTHQNRWEDPSFPTRLDAQPEKMQLRPADVASVRSRYMLQIFDGVPSVTTQGEEHHVIPCQSRSNWRTYLRC